MRRVRGLGFRVLAHTLPTPASLEEAKALLERCLLPRDERGPAEGLAEGRFKASACLSAWHA